MKKVLARNSLVVGLALGLAIMAAALFAVVPNRGHIPTALAVPPPVTEVFVSKTNGEVEKVIVSGGARTVVASTGVGSADSLVFEPSGKLLVTGLGSPNVFRVDPTLPGGAANTGVVVNTTPFTVAAADPAIDAGGNNVLVTNFVNRINVVNLTSGLVTPHALSGISSISGISFDAAGQLWVTDFDAHTVGIADLTANTYTPKCLAVAPGTGGPDGLSLDPTTGKLYVSGASSNSITQLTIGIGTCAIGTVFNLTNSVKPDGIAADGLGGIFAAGQTGRLIRLDTTNGAETVIATGIPGLDDIAPVFGQGAPPTSTPTSAPATATNTSVVVQATNTPAQPVLGGVADYPDLSSGSNVGLLAGVAAAIAFAATACAAWYARRRWLR